MFSLSSQPVSSVDWQIAQAALTGPPEVQAEAVRLFAQQLDNERDSLTPSSCAFYAPRSGCHLDRQTPGRPARLIALALFELHNEPVDISDKNQKIRVLSQYSRVISAITKRYRENLAAAERVRLEELSATNAHSTRLRYCSLKKKPVAQNVLEPQAMPVVYATSAQLNPFFSFLSENLPFDGEFSKESSILVSSDRGDHRVFPQGGAFYRDGRMDLCKQVVGPNLIGSLMNNLAGNDKIRHFLLGNNVIESSGAAAVASAIQENPSLDERIETWYLAGNNIRADGIRSLVDAWIATASATPKSVWLKRNPLKAEGAVALADLLRSSVNLLVLDLDVTGLLDEGVKTIFDALKDNNSLRHIYLTGNGISPVGGQAIADYFQHLKENGRVGLESLIMGSNRLGDEGIIAICSALEDYQHLKRLVFSSNRLEEAGGAAIARLLRKNSSIQMIDIGIGTTTKDLGELPNRLEDGGAAEILSALKENRSLVALNITHNGLSSVGLEDFLNGIEYSNLCHLEIAERFAKASPDAWAKCKAALQRNVRSRFFQAPVADREMMKEFHEKFYLPLKRVKQSENIESIYRTQAFQRKNRKEMIKYWDDPRFQKIIKEVEPERIPQALPMATAPTA